MSRLVINQNAVTPENAEAIKKICPFGAISYVDGKLDISSACKMCKMCVRKGGGVIEYVEEKTQELDKSLWRGVCVFADCTGGEIHRVTYELCGKARKLAEVTGHPVYAIMIGSKTSENAERLLHYGVDKVFVYDHEELADFRIEPYTAAFCDFIEKHRPSSVLIGATNLGRQLAPRVAARCRTGLTADCTMLEMKENTDLVQIRPAFGGNIMAQIITPNTRPQFCTVRYKIFDEPIPTKEPSGQIVHMEVSGDMLRSDIQVIKTFDKQRDVDIAEADVIVAIGRGASGEAMRAYAQELAELLGGMVACTRPLVESNLFDAKHQIGLSGRTVKPKLIICLGISGAVQFAAGMKSSDCIVAINTDPNAPIFDVAHYCITGDVNEIVPGLIEKIRGAKNV
ncbi:MAG: electron transfer flavoprotein subunit alpha/FixB family protein [Ruminococcaceae bacterium]|nr:electron transfer flavoprotein subunit alpha/FixB family protein [Oscillospiraceae bacterium]